eukprot:g39.t1
MAVLKEYDMAIQKSSNADLWQEKFTSCIIAAKNHGTSTLSGIIWHVEAAKTVCYGIPAAGSNKPYLMGIQPSSLSSTGRYKFSESQVCAMTAEVASSSHLDAPKGDTDRWSTGCSEMKCSAHYERQAGLNPCELVECSKCSECISEDATRVNDNGESGARAGRAGRGARRRGGRNRGIAGSPGPLAGSAPNPPAQATESSNAATECLSYISAVRVAGGLGALSVERILLAEESIVADGVVYEMALEVKDEVTGATLDVSFDCEKVGDLYTIEGIPQPDSVMPPDWLAAATTELNNVFGTDWTQDVLPPDGGPDAHAGTGSGSGSGSTPTRTFALGNIHGNEALTKAPLTELVEGADLPEEYNFEATYSKCKPAVRSQGNCASCYAFAVADALAMRECVIGPSCEQDCVISRSVQTMVSCGSRLPVTTSGSCSDPSYTYNLACTGANVGSTMEYVYKYGLPAESTDPYKSGASSNAEGYKEHFNNKGETVPTCNLDAMYGYTGATAASRRRLGGDGSTSISSQSCNDECQYALDGKCDDGGPGSTYSSCAFGSDCSDCGARGGSPTPVPIANWEDMGDPPPTPSLPTPPPTPFPTPQGRSAAQHLFIDKFLNSGADNEEGYEEMIKQAIVGKEPTSSKKLTGTSIPTSRYTKNDNEKAIQGGPVVGVFDVDQALFDYKHDRNTPGGNTGNCETHCHDFVFTPDPAQRKGSHAAVLVGYGQVAGKKYWLVRNSWGDGWGDAGYFKIARGTGVIQYAYSQNTKPHACLHALQFTNDCGMDVLMYIPQEPAQCNSFVRVTPDSHIVRNLDMPCTDVKFATGSALPGYYSKPVKKAEATSKMTSTLSKDQYEAKMKKRVESGEADLLSVQQPLAAQGRAVATMAGAMCVVALMAVMAVYQARRRQKRTAAGYTDIL